MVTAVTAELCTRTSTYVLSAWREATRHAVATREAIDNIILDELAPVEQVREGREMIDALRQKEDALAAQIETFDADIAETIAKVDRLWSTRAREQVSAYIHVALV
ncbi:hypothetical protein Pmar_PMAR029343 [Perkinsus marinus ATCC 50983]|uniref:Uncharacterized protein n=1 Tax=Perkinsus marinus (strain ATCC 50983 / TXsc) TaxID=423536 RepID=C5KMW3_PERM5|nr:hypothetical protein Pmar_PMAR029343 [Perkinsus marinus ATCC 50983]EER14271.1 hypothetical protein Pmar_PMAR029343 [Perkinsus marinus ATCC 50983]|eukprot:XP_002782476.1 hypothetical protein Pmar_PMAR029343 [Perkinsus marinus ATCC 50983]